MAIRRVAFLGLGAMGLPMARNVLQQGYELHVAAHRNREPVEILKAEGAVEHLSVTELVSQCEAVISILPADREMESVLLSGRMLESMPEGSVLIEMTSGSPGMMKSVHEAYRAKGIRVLDAPVSGGTVGADKGTLTVMAGGDTDVLEYCRPLLEAMSQKIYHAGPVCAGKAVKAVNQMLAAIHMIAAAEALALSEKLDIDAETLQQVIGASSGASWMLTNKLDGLKKRNYNPGFKLSLMKKDIQIAITEAGDLSMPLASLALRLYQESEHDDGGLDFSAVGKQILT